MILTKDTIVIADYLTRRGFLQKGEEVVAAEVPGAGNMNFTLRITTNQRTFIIKQSRPYVEKYPQVAAPQDRCQREAEFYTLVSVVPDLDRMTPNILLQDKEHNILVMNDLGGGSDFTAMYSNHETISNVDLQAIMTFAARLHTSVNTDTAAFTIANREMRQLNYEHMYVYPFMKDNGLNLDDLSEGLATVAYSYMDDLGLMDKIRQLGEAYLSDGAVLLHGDYFLGSWLKTKDGIHIIDPEFCFFGSPEFEIGVVVAHLSMSRHSDTEIDTALRYYTELAPLDMSKVWQHAGVEIMRRIMGLAQLPINHDIEERKVLLAKATRWLKNND